MRTSTRRILSLAPLCAVFAVGVSSSASAFIENPHPWASGEAEEVPSKFAEAADEYHPWVHYPSVRTIDLSSEALQRNDYTAQPVEQPDFYSLDDAKLSAEEIDAAAPTSRPASDLSAGLPDGWVQRGNVVLPQPVADGLKDVGTGPIFAVEDIPGNKYPRKHTLFLNFNGGMLFTGSDNSAENRSNLAKQGVYPTYGGGEATALSVVQAVENDLAQFGVNVIYDFRPRKLVPYTMEMVGGSWTDTNIDSPAGGVAPGADCGALGQRHVVYTFSNGGSVLGAANTISQEAGHAWGLDHSLNCGSVMSYCGGGDGAFLDSCDGLCEAACQGDAGCRLTHDMFCGDGNDQQNEVEELTWIFGGNEPDVEPPTVEIVEPADGLEVEDGADLALRAIVDDNYGGFGWQFIITKDGEEVYNQPDYDRDVDDEFRAALNFAGLETGVYTFTVEVEDQFENVTSQTVTVNVGGATTTDDSASDSDSDAGSDTETDSDSDSVGSTGGSDSDSESDTNQAEDDEPSDDEDEDDGDTDGGTGEPGADDPKGCGCTADGPSQGLGTGLLFMLGLVSLRRRRSAAQS